MTLNSMRKHRQDRPGRNGYTLIDLVVTLLILISMGTVALPRGSAAIANYRVEAAARQLAASLNYASRTAALTNQPVTFTFDVDNDSYAVTGMNDPDHSQSAWTVSIPELVKGTSLDSINLGGDSTVVFDISGRPDADGTIIVRAKLRTLTISISSASGKATIL